MNFKSALAAAANRISPIQTVATTDKKKSVKELFLQIQEKLNAAESNSTAYYSVKPDDWYKTYPYRFVIQSEYGNTYYSLPIPPESLSYQMVAASQLIPTLGGIVEETSENVFWQIALSGTTGIAIGRIYNPPDKTDSAETVDEMASSEANFRNILKGGIFSNTFNKLTNISDSIQGAIDNPQSGIYGLLEGLASTNQRYNKSAVRNNISQSNASVTEVAGISAFQNILSTTKNASTNGYVEIHLLHNFLNAYSKLKELSPTTTNLFFESQKDNMQWQVAVKNFVFQKNAAQPYLYKYNIILQGFNLKQPGDFGVRKNIDRFGPNGDLGEVSSFTISGALERGQSLARKLTTNPLGLIASKPPII